MKKYLLILLFLAIAVAGVGFYFYNKKPADTNDLKEDFVITASELVAEFEGNENLATQKYSDKILLITGEIAELKTDVNPTVQLAGTDPLSGVTCSFYQDELAAVKSLTIGSKLTVKGKCTGKLMDVVINNCRIQNP